MWKPTEEQINNSQMMDYMQLVNQKFGLFESLIAAALIGALIGDLLTYQTSGSPRFEAHDWLIIGLIAALPRLRRSDESETE